MHPDIDCNMDYLQPSLHLLIYLHTTGRKSALNKVRSFRYQKLDFPRYPRQQRSLVTEKKIE